jgi:serine/threonine protein kinase
VGVVLPQPVQFGKYTLFERIGRGGMADVFKGRVQGPAGFERIFVVKRILPHLSDDPTFTKMFIEEAKMSARLNHPNIVQVFELGSVEGEYFISMEYVRGHDLAETMRTLWARVGPPRPELVAYVGREMCRALDYAHNVRTDDGKLIGMIHRDVSPSNVMLSFEGSVKLLDFGIAKALGGEGSDEGTQKGTLKGKFAYMAPEQTRGNDVDSRIDIFASGIVLHEILTGRRLFKGENDLQTVEKVRQCEVPPPSLQNPLCPPELDAIVLQALARNPDHRFQSGGEMADALDDIVHASRFQPSHLAGLMRDLFPGEAPQDGRQTSTGSVRVSQSMPSSNSRPYTLQVRSPTVPPVSVSASGTGGSSLAQQAAEAAALANQPIYKKPAFLVAVALVLGVGGFGGGMILVNSNARPQVIIQSGTTQFKDGPLRIDVDSIPGGADVYDKASNKLLCTTPCVANVDWKTATPTVLVLRKEGYEETSKDVRPGLKVFASLKAAIGSGNRRPMMVMPPPTNPLPVQKAPEPPPAPEEEPTRARSHRSSSSSHSSAPSPSGTQENGTKTPSTNNGSGKSPKKTPASELVNPF